MAKKIEKINYIKLLQKLDRNHLFIDDNDIIYQIIRNIEKIKITDEDVNEISNSYVSAYAFLVMLTMILNHPDRFVIERPQFQKLCNIIFDKKIKESETGVSPSIYNHVCKSLENWLDINSSYIDYDENGADIVLPISNLKDLLLKVDGYRICANKFTALIDFIRQEQLDHITSKILVNDVEQNKQLIKNTFGNVNVVNSNGHSLLMLCQNRDLTDDQIYKLIINLLEAGVDPNIRNYKMHAYSYTYDYLELILDNECFDDFVNIYFSDIFKKSIEFGYNPDSNVSLLNFVVNKRHKYATKIYDAVCQYDFIVFDDEKDRDFKNLIFNGYSDIANSIKYRTILCKIGEKLEENNYVLENDFYNKLIEAEKEILIFFNSILYNFDEKELINLLVSKIIENRNNCVNLIDEKVSAVEVLNSLRLIVEYFYSNFNNACDKCVTKIKNM